eukprot:1177472-Prorocentrum_minimum.AAC.2
MQKFCVLGKFSGRSSMACRCVLKKPFTFTWSKCFRKEAASAAPCEGSVPRQSSSIITTLRAHNWAIGRQGIGAGGSLVE